MLFFTLEKIEKLLWEIEPTVEREVYPIPGFRFHAGDAPGAHHPDFDDRAWADFAVGDFWGGYDKTAWFRAVVPIPAHLRMTNGGGPEDRGYHKVTLRFQAGPRDGGHSTAEAMLYVNGAPLQGIDIWHEHAVLPPDYLAQEHLPIALKAWSGTIVPPPRRRFALAQLTVIDTSAEHFYHMAEAVRQAVIALPEDDWRRVRLIDVLNRSFHHIDFAQVRSEGYYYSIEEARRYLHAALQELEALEDEKPRVTAIGHAHIDLAWLWRLEQTREKAGRTFATALNLMRQYPEYRFMHSSPQLYEHLSQDFPELFAQVKERIAEGRWEITGGMWIEPDSNVPNGESLTRQFVYGQRYMQETFGVRSQVLWLPDIFGFSAALPQIAVKAGMKYLFTTKPSWNQFNRMPHDTMRWRGLDGTELLVFIGTTPEHQTKPHVYTYNGTLSPFELLTMWKNYRQKLVNDELLTTFGWGDGGGGPTAGILESGRVMANLPGFPMLEQGTVEAFFARLGERVKHKAVPVWDGEIYLEYHRGTYTSQAQVKRANRKLEIAFHNVELLASMGDILLKQAQFPDLRDAWKLLLYTQFHDIIPGSSIREVYEDTERDHAHLTEQTSAALAAALDRLTPQLHADGPSVAFFNGNSFSTASVVEVPMSAETEPILAGKTLAVSGGQPWPSQVTTDADGRKSLLLYTSVPELGYHVCGLIPNPTEARSNHLSISASHLENDSYRIELNARGQITSIFDKAWNREVLAPGARGNVLQVFEDKPMNFDAWDIDLYYQEKCREIDDLAEVVVEESGPLRATLRLVWRYFNSTITQRIRLYFGSRAIDFVTEIDWKESQQLLKAAFPVAIRATKATYEVQYGHVERPTHWNTSWDWARFEVPAQRWADLSEADYGVTLLNDCKYGYDIHDNVMRLTLLKSAVRPDPQADKMVHHFTYRLLPHGGTWREANVVREAAELNNPPLARLIPTAQDGSLPDRLAFVTTEQKHIVLDTVKRAEDGDGWIVRLYDYAGARGSVTLSFAQPVAHAIVTNLLEEPLESDDEPVTVDGSTVTFMMRPFEVKTLRVGF